MVTKHSTYGSAVVIILTCFRISVGELSTDRVWKTNCFGETDSGRCEDSWIKISSTYYVCEMVIELAAPPKRIGYVNGDIWAAIGSQTYVIHNETLKPTTTVRFFPPRDELVDKRDNKYYAADGTTYVAESETKKEIEILTTGEYSVNQLAFDKESNHLLILSFRMQSETNTRAGSLFFINTETVDVDNDNVQAEIIEEIGDSITALAVEGDSGKLLLGTRTPQGGKLIRLTKQEDNPCSENNVGKAAIVDVIKETQNKLLKIFYDISARLKHLGSLDTNALGKSQSSLLLENAMLKKELFVVSSKLDSFNDKLFGFKNHLKYVQMKITNTNSMSSSGQGSNSGSFNGIHLPPVREPPPPPPRPTYAPPPIVREPHPPPPHPTYPQPYTYAPPPTYTPPSTNAQPPRPPRPTAPPPPPQPPPPPLPPPSPPLYVNVPISTFNMISQQAEYMERTNQEFKTQLEQLSLDVEDLLKESNQLTVWRDMYEYNSSKTD